MTPNASLFQQVMGDEFRKLDPALQRFHSLQGRHELEGRVQTNAPQTWAARLLALTIGILFGIYSSVLVASPLAMWLGVSREHFIKTKKQVEGANEEGAVV